MNPFKLTIFGALIFLSIQSIAQSAAQVTFENLNDERVMRIFLEVVDRYNELDNYQITVKRQKIKSATMQAQPLVTFRTFFSSTKHYRVKLSNYVRDSNKYPVASLSDDVLKGWFAHELGHIVDYAPYATPQMIFYGLKYLYSKKFKQEAEYAADFIAIQNGFAKEIIASKQFLLNNENLSDRYKLKIKQFYMSVETVEQCNEYVQSLSAEL
jgi:hypothetical protein